MEFLRSDQHEVTWHKNHWSAVKDVRFLFIKVLAYYTYVQNEFANSLSDYVIETKNFKLYNIERLKLECENDCQLFFHF